MNAYMFTDKHGVEKHIPRPEQVQINAKHIAETIIFGDHQLKCLRAAFVR